MTKWSIFSRMGGKFFSREKIVSYFPTSYTTFVEPFLGGGQILLELLQNHYDPNIKYVGNDINKNIYDIWKDIKKTNSEELKNLSWKGTESKFNELKALKPTSRIQRLYRNLYLSWYSFGSLREYFADKRLVKGKRLIENIDDINERLKKVTILNQDYKKVIEKYDGPTTLFYIDSPYTDKDHYYEGNGINPNELAEVCKKIKGKFVLSYDTSKEVKKAFKNFKFHTIQIPYRTGKEKVMKTEYIITNF